MIDLSKLIAITAAAALSVDHGRASLMENIDRGFFDDILGGEGPMFSGYHRALSMPDMRDFIPTSRSVRGFKAGGSSKQHHTTKRSKDARKARAITRKSP